jgi:ketosteroid isomerase-like protein
MSDIEDIRRVLAEYCFATDSGDSDAWLATFTNDIVWEGGAFGRFSGIAEAQAYHSASAGSAVNFRHFTTNSIIDIEGSQARVCSYIQVYDQSGQSPVLVFSGLYADVFEKSNRKWRIKVRRLLPHPKELALLRRKDTQPA